MAATRGSIRRGQPLKAFTLIEVLVVVSIIALLIAILMPSLALARAMARSTMCQSNIHQFGLAMTSYATGNEGYIPRGGASTTPHWTIMIARMLGDTTSYTYMSGSTKKYNPSMLPVDKRPLYQCPDRTSINGMAFVDYVWNDLTPTGPAVDGWYSKQKDPFALDTYKRPGETIFIADAELFSKNVIAPKCGTGMKEAYDNAGKIFKVPTLAGPPDNLSGVDAMDVWAGAHLPEGKADSDGPLAGQGTMNDDSKATGPRRVARNMHLGKQSNYGFYDGHAAPLPLLDRTTYPTAPDRYKVWLRRFGVFEQNLNDAVARRSCHRDLPD